MRRAVLGATLGQLVEWFEIAVYGFLAVTIGDQFFDTDDSSAALLGSFAVFAAAFVIRPLGGVFFGNMGDRMGRKRTLAIVLILASGATFGIGLLPTYASIGVFAPALLVLLRLLQGFSAGGEVGGASAFVAEHAPPGRRGFYVSWVQFGSVAGFLVGSLVVLVLTLVLTGDQMDSWGWRVPFLMAAPMGLIGLYVRNRLEETPEFTELRQQGEVARRPLVETLTDHWRSVVVVAGFALYHNATLYVVLTFVPSYLESTLDYSAVTSSVSSAITMTAVAMSVPCFGALSDSLGRRRLLGSSCVLAIAFAYPLFWLMGQGTPALAVLAHVALGVILGVFIGPALAAMNELFTTRVRYGGFSLGYNVSASAFGGTAPFLVTMLITQTGSDTSPALYVMATAAATLGVVVAARETAPRITGGG
ncbi:MFS transporter [Streptomyces sp. AJS327]|nr:MFS transporter [Streptomyces sp. AJS327]